MLEVLLLAIALSMDAFAVSVGLGIKNKNNLKETALKAGLYFGVFQAIMPFIGYMGGIGLKKYIDGYDEIISFILLVGIGLKMIYESFQEKDEENIKKLTNKVFLALALATSLDAMAAGYSLHLFNLNIYFSIFIIGLTTFVVSYIGTYVGSKGGNKYESKAEFLGGLVLVLIGIKILIF